MIRAYLLTTLQNFMPQYFKLFFLSVLLMLPRQALADVNIAIVAPLAGDFEVLGHELVNGAKIAVDEINNNGGLEGEKVNLVVVDDQCNNLLAVSTAQMIAVNSSEKDKINLVVGPFCQDALSEAAKTYAQAKIMQIIPTSVSETEMAALPKSLVKMVGASEQQSLDFFKFYLKNFDNQRLALVYNSGNKEIVSLAASLQEEFHKAGKLLYFKSFNFANYQKDYSKMAEDIIDDKNQVVMVLGGSKEVTRLAKALRREDSKLPLFVNRYQVQGRYFEDMGNLAEGTYFLSLPTLKDNTEFTETLVKLRLLGVEPEGLSVYSYSAVKLWAAMVDVNNSYKFDKMVAALSDKSFETTWGIESFKGGMPENPVNYGIYQFRDGEYTQVY